MGTLHFPTELHKAAIESIRDFFVKEAHVDTILLTNSCARGKATTDSDIDFAILVKPLTPVEAIDMLERKWLDFLRAEPILVKYSGSHRFAHIHLDVIDGVYQPATWDDGGGPDNFEIAIGNHLVYSAPLAGKGDYFNNLQAQWLPYYNYSLQGQRLQMAKEACMNDLDHIPFLVKRTLYFHAFDKLYKACQEFLQALFISHAIYPIAYNKWIKEQVDKILHLPALYKKLSQVISVSNIESDEVKRKGGMLRSLLEEYC